jgi:hypothetical protein
MKTYFIIFFILLFSITSNAQNTFNTSYPFNFTGGVFTNVFFQHPDTILVTGNKNDSTAFNCFTMLADRYGSPTIKAQSTKPVFVRNTIFKNKNNEWGVLSGLYDSISIVFFNTDSITRIISTSRIYNQITYTPILLLKDNHMNFLIGGEFKIPNTSNYKTFLIKLDSLGNLIWRKEYGNNINCNMIRSLSLDHDGGYLIGGGVGNLYSYVSGTLPQCQATIFKTDTAGTVLWQWQDTAHYCSMQAFGLQPTDDNGYIYTNWQATRIDTNGFGSVSQYYYAGRYFITKLNSNRNLEFEKVFGGIQSYDEGVLLYTLKKTNDGNFVAVGHRFLNDSLQNDLIIGGYGYIVKFASDGNVIWQRTYANVINPQNFTLVMNKLYDFDFKADGGIIACGDVLDFTLPSQQQKAWLLSLDSYGCLSAGCHLFDAVTETEKKEGVFKAYPNPANDVLYIQHLPGFETQQCELQMADITGKIVMQQKLINQEVTYIFSTETLNNGIYFLSLKTESGLVQTEKIMVNR